jgi:hypothetical protein
MKAIAGAASLRAGTASVDSIVSTLLLLLLLLFILDPAAMRQGVIVKRSPRASSWTSASETWWLLCGIKLGYEWCRSSIVMVSADCESSKASMNGR